MVVQAFKEAFYMNKLAI